MSTIISDTMRMKTSLEMMDDHSHGIALRNSIWGKERDMDAVINSCPPRIQDRSNRRFSAGSGGQ